MKITNESKVAAGFCISLLIIIVFVVNTFPPAGYTIPGKGIIPGGVALIAVIVFIFLLLYLFVGQVLALHRKAELKLQQQNLELEMRLSTCTSGFAENEQRLNKKVEELNSFMYKATHDLRSPLASVIGLVHIAESEAGDPEALRSYFKMIHKSMNSMEKLLLDLVSITYVSQSALKPEKIGFDAITGDILDALSHYPDFEKIVVSRNISEKAVFYSDRRLLYSVLQNLIDNAIKYRRMNDSIIPKLVITIESSIESVIINICDNGIGIPPKAHEKVFDMFYRATSVASGTGLGLYIVKGSVEKMKGRVLLKNLVSGGTSIYVTLPNMMPAQGDLQQFPV